MASLDDEIRKNKEILKALEEAIQNGPWEQSLFFRGIGKKLRDLRDQFKHELELDDISEENSNSSANPNSTLSATTQPMIEVYVSLYQAEGTDIRRWTAVVNSLVKLSISRPVYKNETDIQAAIRAKEYKHNDAYVAVKVAEQDILHSTDKVPLDRYGHELLLLKETAVKLDNVVRFMHSSGEYDFHNGSLIKKNLSSTS